MTSSPSRSPFTLVALFLCALMNSSESSTIDDDPDPPVARRDESRTVLAGVAPPGWDSSLPRQAANSPNPLMDPSVPISDPYGWLRDDERTSPEVLEHLAAENEYAKSRTGHLKELQDELYEEFLSKLEETDHSAPRPDGDWVYYSRTYEGSSYPAYCRAPRTPDYVERAKEWDGAADSPVLPGEAAYLDVNELAKNRTYCSVSGVARSPSQGLMAYAVDYVGGERYELHVRDLASGDDVALRKTASGEGEDDGDGDLLEVGDGAVWGKDDETLYYVTTDEAQRPYRLYRRENWKSKNNFTDTLLKEETDPLFTISVEKSFDEQYIFYGTGSKDTSEVWYANLTSINSTEEMECVSPRRNKILYDVESHDGSWYIVTNVDRSQNMKLMTAPAGPNTDSEWELVEDGDGNPIFDGSLAKSLDGVTAFESHAVLEGREDGIPRVWTYSFATKAFNRLEFDEAAYAVELSTNYEVGVDKIAIDYSSMLTPPSSIEIALEDVSSRTVLKKKAVPGYDESSYGTDRLNVLSRDGETLIPVSVVYRKDAMEGVRGGDPAPLHLYGYGSYGSSIEASFSVSSLPLLDRGVIYAIAHVRGGGELGRVWYEEPDGGKLLCKENTFDDFVDVARHLTAGNNWTTSEMLSCEGRSAGGLLIGAAINQAPELFRAAILGVPFVDVVVTMTDASIPLTTEEWIEWGNPNEEKYFQYMMDYSPMNNVQTGKTYPSCWITGGLHDPRVAYWEPAKFAATLRHANPDSKNPVCLKIDLGAGHFSASDRYKYYRELAYDYSFLLDQLGLAETGKSQPDTDIADCAPDQNLGLGWRMLAIGLCWSRLIVA